MDILIWGMMSVWLAKQGSNTPEGIVLVILSGLVFWHVLYQANVEIAKSILDEFWTQNLINLFSTPLSTYDWLAAVMLLGVFRMFLSIILGAAVVWLFYSLNIFTVGWALIPFACSLLITGWFMGIFTAGIILVGGMRASWLAWATGWLLAPFSGVFYSIDMLPKSVQIISWALPTTYIFEGMRQVILQKSVPYSYLAISYGLNLVYLILTIIFFNYMFEKSRDKGLARIE